MIVKNITVFYHFILYRDKCFRQEKEQEQEQEISKNVELVLNNKVNSKYLYK